MPLVLIRCASAKKQLPVTVKELDSGWVFAYGHMRLGRLPQKLGVGIPGRACENSALNGEVPAVIARVNRDITYHSCNVGRSAGSAIR